MSKSDKFQERGVGSYKRNTNTLDVKSGKAPVYIVLSFKQFDPDQLQTFESWQRDNLLAKALNKLKSICNLTVHEAFQQGVITQYTKVIFPPNSEFNHPKHIPTNVVWCSMNIQGKERLIGYFENNIF